MYDELVKRLREQVKCNKKLYPQGALFETLLLDLAADAIEELMRRCEQFQYMPPPAWIPVTERLPDSGVCVLVTDGLEVGEGWITEIINTKGHFSLWCCPTADIDVDRRPITHWMPMPKTPKEE